MSEGWIKLHRGIAQHWIFQNESYLKAWVTILLNVNYETKKVLINKELITCERGESCMSLKSWTKLFGKKWTLQKTRTLLNLLEKDKMITKISTHNTTKITVCNYESYQSEQHANNTQITRKQHTNNKQITTTKESKESKEDIICAFVESVNQYECEPILKAYMVKAAEKIQRSFPKVMQMKKPLTAAQLSKLIEFYGYEKVEDKLMAMQNYAPLLNKLEDAYLTIVSWLRKDNKAA